MKNRETCYGIYMKYHNLMIKLRKVKTTVNILLVIYYFRYMRIHKVNFTKYSLFCFSCNIITKIFVMTASLPSIKKVSIHTQK